MVEIQSFGKWLRHRRKMMDLTQSGLAKQVGCATVTIHKIEQDQLFPSRQLAELIFKFLQVPPAEINNYIQFARGGQFSIPPASPTNPNNLPKLISSFVGREKEIASICQLLETNRLVVITGSGGTGKTRLALRCAEEILSRFPDGTWFVDLASLTDPRLFPQAITIALGLHEVNSDPRVITNYLVGKRLLLILDNCEHLLAAVAPLVNEMLRACPQLTLLATSRERLGVAGEIAYRVPSLSVPNFQRKPPLEETIQFDALRLFNERAVAVSPGFTISEHNVVTVGSICRRLDGIPLAIELAAARIRMMTADQISARLDQAFGLLADSSLSALPRQRTIKATIDWSYNLLTAPEKNLLHRLSVFSGGWTLEAAEQVCPNLRESDRSTRALTSEARSDEVLMVSEILELLGHLLDKSLVTLEVNEAGTGRYRMLEVVRQYARVMLVESGWEDSARDRHLDYYHHLAELAEPHIRGWDQKLWLGRLKDDLDNIRQALDWALRGRVTDGLLLVAALHQFWHIHGLASEGISWHERLLDADKQRPEPLGNETRTTARLARARALRVGHLAAIHGSQDTLGQNNTKLEEGVAICRDLGPIARRDLGYLLLGLADSQILLNQEEAGTTLQESLEIGQELDDAFLISECLWLSFRIPLDKADFKKSLEILESCLTYRRKAGDQDGMGSCLYTLALYALLGGNYEKANELFDESLANLQVVQNQWSLAILYYYRTLMARAQGHYDLAIQWGEEALAIYRSLGEKLRESLWLCGQGITNWASGDYALAVQHGKEALAIAEAIKSDYPIATIFHLLGRAALSQGNLTLADQHFKRMVAALIDQNTLLMIREPGPKRNQLETAYAIETLAVLASAKGLMRQSVVLFSAIQESEKWYGGCYCPRERSEHQSALESAQQALGDTGYSDAWKAGKSLTLEQALAEAKAVVMVNKPD